MAKKGLIISNGFLSGETYSKINTMYLEAAKKANLSLTPVFNSDIPLIIENGNISIAPEFICDFAIFLDKDITLAAALEKSGMRLFNKSESVRICDDKSLTHMALSGHNIPMPKTVVSPMTFENIGYNCTSFAEKAAELIGYPVVVKECFGSFGMQVYKADNLEMLLDIVEKINPHRFIMQEFVKTSVGRDVRINVVGGVPVAAMKRSSKTDFRANFTIGGSVEKYLPTKEQLDLAVYCCDILGLDFAGVDLLFGENENPLLCEVNSNAHILGILQCTGVNVAEHIIKHIKNSI